MHTRTQKGEETTKEGDLPQATIIPAAPGWNVLRLTKRGKLLSTPIVAWGIRAYGDGSYVTDPITSEGGVELHTEDDEYWLQQPTGQIDNIMPGEAGDKLFECLRAEEARKQEEELKKVMEKVAVQRLSNTKEETH